MDLRDAIAIPATFAFVGLGFLGIVRHRLNWWRRQATTGRDRVRGNTWRQLSPRAKMLRRVAGICLGVGAALAVQAVVRVIIDGLSS